MLACNEKLRHEHLVQTTARPQMQIDGNVLPCSLTFSATLRSVQDLADPKAIPVTKGRSGDSKGERNQRCRSLGVQTRNSQSNQLIPRSQAELSWENFSLHGTHLLWWALLCSSTPETASELQSLLADRPLFRRYFTRTGRTEVPAPTASGPSASLVNPAWRSVRLVPPGLSPTLRTLIPLT